MTERTISAEEREDAEWEVAHAALWEVIHAITNPLVYEQANIDLDVLGSELARLSAWVSGDVARARELAKEIKRAGKNDDGAACYALAAEIVALLKPPDSEPPA